MNKKQNDHDFTNKEQDTIKNNKKKIQESFEKAVQKNGDALKKLVD